VPRPRARPASAPGADTGRPMAHPPARGGGTLAEEHTGAAERAHAAGVPAAAALLAGSVLLSRVLGFARESLLAYRVGAGSQADAYYAAFQLPDLLNYFLAGGALSIAFLPLYAALRERDEAEAERLLATVLGTLGLVVAAATAVMWLAAGPLVALQFPRFDTATRALTVHLTRIVLPAQIFFVLGGVVQATLLARGRFAAAALAPLLYNGGIVAGGLVLAPSLGVEGFSWGALAGAVLGPFAIPWLDARRRIRIGVRFDARDPDFRRYLWMAAPLMFGLTLLTVDEWYGRWFGGRLGEGAIALLSFARKLMQFPVAVVGQAIGQAALPALATLWAQGRRADLDRTLETTLRAALALAVLAAGAAVAFAAPLVDFVYRHGAFTPEDAVRVARLLALFAAAVPAWVLQQIAVRAFYARGDTWRPMLLGTVFAVLAIPVYLQLGARYGVPGVAAAGVIAMSANALATLLLARRLHGAPKLGPLAASTLRALGIAAAAALAGGACVRHRPGTVGALLDLGIGGTVFAAVAAVGIWTLGDRPLRQATARALRRLVRRPAPG
jgi:putative peptidoglycan lipid II flippase